MKVAELMLDNPNQFLCNLGSLEAGRRILALTAEDEIEAGNSYVLFPMPKLRSLLSEWEMRRIEEIMKKKSSSQSNIIVPLSHNGANEEEMKRRRGRQRCWKPSLHTIQEIRSLKFAENAQERPVLTFRLRKRH